MLLSVGGEVLDQEGQDAEWKRFAVIMYNSRSQFVFSERLRDDFVSSYICQLQQEGLSAVQSHSTEV